MDTAVSEWVFPACMKAMTSGVISKHLQLSHGGTKTGLTLYFKEDIFVVEVNRVPENPFQAPC